MKGQGKNEPHQASNTPSTLRHSNNFEPHSKPKSQVEPDQQGHVTTKDDLVYSLADPTNETSPDGAASGVEYAQVNKVKPMKRQPDTTLSNQEREEYEGVDLYMNSCNQEGIPAVYYSNTASSLHNHDNTVNSNTESDLVYSLAQPIDDLVQVDNELYDA